MDPHPILRHCYLRRPIPASITLGLWLTISAATASLAQESNRVVFAAGNVELSPVLTWTGKRPLGVAPQQLIGTGDSGWVVLERPRTDCPDAYGRIWAQVKERRLLGPRTIHTVGEGGGACKVSSERRLQQIFANLGECASGCEHMVTVAVGPAAVDPTLRSDPTKVAGLATEALFDSLLAASSLTAVRPRHVEALLPKDAAAPGASDLCQRYAASAAAQHLENQSKGCGLSGSGWSADPQEHLSWCRQGDNRRVSNLERRRTSRRRILDQCRPRATSHQCAELAAAVAALQDENLWLGCGLEGADWNADFAKHYDRCTRGGKLEHLPQMLERQRSALGACKQR